MLVSFFLTDGAADKVRLILARENEHKKRLRYSLEASDDETEIYKCLGRRCFSVFDLLPTPHPAQ